MNADEWCSCSSSINLPTSKAAKVSLAVDNSTISRNSFLLYNPFSRKAKFLKWCAKTLFCYANPLAKYLLASTDSEKKPFHHYLEKKLSVPLTISVYRATAKDKLVFQLQTKDAEVLGYIKKPLNKLGQHHLLNEKHAIDILSVQKIIPTYMFFDYFNNVPYLMFKPLNGVFTHLDNQALEKILTSFKREKEFQLHEHPRIIQLHKNITEQGMSGYRKLLQSICQQSEKKYCLVYEHGDFTPWNIIRINQDYIPFDFEYFVENGIEFFDLIKYHYQVATLLGNKTGRKLVEYLHTQIDIDELTLLLQLFLIKEIVISHKENQSYEEKSKLLKLLASHKYST